MSKFSKFNFVNLDQIMQNNFTIYAILLLILK